MRHNRSAAVKAVAAAVVPIAVAAVLAGCADSGAGGSSGGKVYTIKYSDSNAESTPQVRAANDFKKLVEQSTGGRVKVTVYPNGVLGATDKETGQVAGNVVQMSDNSVVPLAQYDPAFNFFQIPMIFKDQSQVDKGFQSDAVKKLESDFQAKSGVRILAWQELGWVQFFNSVHPVVTPADMKNLKFRIIPGSDPLQQSLAQLGSQPVPLAFSETYTAAQAGTVNANEEPPTIVDGDKEYEILKYMSELNFQYNPNPVMINEKFYESLPPDLQQKVTEAAQQAAKDEIADVQSVTDQTITKFKSSGVQVTTLTDAQRQQFSDAIRPYLASTVGSYSPDLFTAFGVDVSTLSGR